MDFKFYSLSVCIYSYCCPTQFPWCFCRLTEARRASLVRQNMIALPEHRSLHTVCVGFVLLNLWCFSVVFIDHCLSLWPLNCMYNKYNEYRLTTYDYPFGILNLLHYLSTYYFRFMCMFCRSLFGYLSFHYYCSSSSSSRCELVRPNSQRLMTRSLLNFTGR